MRPSDHPRCPDCGSVDHTDPCGDTTLRNAWQSALAQVKEPAPALDLDALLAQADSEHRERTTGIGAGNCVACRGKWPCETVGLAAAVRTLRADYDTALDAIDHLNRGWHIRWLDDKRHWEMGGQRLRREPVTEAQDDVLAAAEEKRHER